uniref:(northern house mosquito) hypothetical protein n=1 Tax=Culex pipiens TaxID=7175 RepID=A0A8D8MFH6_CULPI
MHKLREMLVISILHTHARILSPLDNKKVCFSSRSTLSRLLDVVDRTLGNCRRGFLGVRHLASLDRVVGVLAGRRTLHHLAGVDVRGRVRQANHFHRVLSGTIRIWGFMLHDPHSSGFHWNEGL